MSRRAENNSAGMYTCGLCGFTSASLAGLRVHEHVWHPAGYHSALAIGHRTGNKRRWHLEKVLVAREELRLKQVFGDNLNVRLATAFPERTFESIKGLRRHLLA